MVFPTPSPPCKEDWNYYTHGASFLIPHTINWIPMLLLTHLPLVLIKGNTRQAQITTLSIWPCPVWICAWTPAYWTSPVTSQLLTRAVPADTSVLILFFFVPFFLLAYLWVCAVICSRWTLSLQRILLSFHSNLFCTSIKPGTESLSDLPRHQLQYAHLQLPISWILIRQPSTTVSSCIHPTPHHHVTWGSP